MAWWLLYDVLKEMEEEQTGNVDFHIKGGMGDDHITFRDGVGTIYDPNVAQDNIELGIESNKVRVKYGEDEILQKASDYINSTYSSHYTNEGSNIQTLDLIESVGDAEAFCRSNAIKYLSRYDKKGRPQHDILKAIHYCVLLYHFTSKPIEIEPDQRYETF
jgi:hypothetical protein|tara:strand:- start:819 stop:1301 length:483 start_codon:yes stop_codon:yes gene_type:complete